MQDSALTETRKCIFFIYDLYKTPSFNRKMVGKSNIIVGLKFQNILLKVYIVLEPASEYLQADELILKYV